MLQRAANRRPYIRAGRVYDKQEFEDVYSNNESGGPNGVSKFAGQSGTRCQRALPDKLKFAQQGRYRAAKGSNEMQCTGHEMSADTVRLHCSLIIHFQPLDFFSTLWYSVLSTQG